MGGEGKIINRKNSLIRFRNLFQNQSQFPQNMAKSSFRLSRCKFVQMKSHTLFQREVITKLRKHIEENLKLS